jgi:hypothetical protein
MNTTTGIITTSKQFLLNSRDFIKALLVVCASAVLTYVSEAFQHGILTFNWQDILQVAVLAGAGYLAKNWLTPSATIITLPTIQPPVKNETPVTVVTPTLPIAEEIPVIVKTVTN